MLPKGLNYKNQMLFSVLPNIRYTNCLCNGTALGYYVELLGTIILRPRDLYLQDTT
jgi:hypothetical protein